MLVYFIKKVLARFKVGFMTGSFAFEGKFFAEKRILLILAGEELVALRNPGKVPLKRNEPGVVFDPVLEIRHRARVHRQFYGGIKAVSTDLGSSAVLRNRLRAGMPARQSTRPKSVLPVSSSDTMVSLLLVSFSLRVITPPVILNIQA